MAYVFHIKALQRLYSRLGSDKCLSDAHKNVQNLKNNYHNFLLQKQIQPIFVFNY